MKYRKDVAAKRLFPPRYAKPSEAKQALLQVIRRDPRQLGFHSARWRLEMIVQACTWLQVSTAGSLSRLLKRLGISYKRGRDYVHSPDRHYQEKLSLIELARLRAYYEPDRYVLLYLDQLTYYRQPTIAQSFESKGLRQPLAQRSHQANSSFRIIGAINCMTGQLSYLQRKRITRTVIANFWTQLYQCYPGAETIYVVLDNWPVHFHPDVLAVLQPQQFPFPPKLPGNWPTEPAPKAKQDNMPVQLLPLPTYASWLNPIEKLWRWLKQEVLHLHRFSDDWPELREVVASFLDQFATGSDALLRYVGLLPI
ncbi:MAG: IS630 family transposase [Ardenticatenaceae bacterium]|nr:IS630 family transposase [Ardenticatenaceae bacterium]